MIWRMKFECEASCCFLGEGADMVLTGIRAILPQRSGIAPDGGISPFSPT